MTNTSPTNPALHTDKYELTMLDALVREGKHREQATFEVFARRLTPGFRYGVFAGLGRLLPMIEEFSFFDVAEAPEWEEFRKDCNLSDETWDYLSSSNTSKFNGNIIAYREGDLYFPHSPVLTVIGELGQCLLLETLVLSVLNHDSAIATKASRMVSVANDRGLIEMGSRRTHEEAAVAAARAAYIAGFDSTSNMAAGHLYGIPCKGTAAHAFTLAHESEKDAFAAQIEAQGPETTFLVDTYDVGTGVENALKACAAVGAYPGGVRIDSGDLAANARKARRILDNAGATDTKIVVTSDLDEYVLKDLKDAPIDGYGIGTQLVSTPPAGFVYKLVEIEGRPVAKKSKDKVSVGGRKYAYRTYDRNWKVSGEFFTSKPLEILSEHIDARQFMVVEDGQTLPQPSLKQARAFAKSLYVELPKSEQKVWSGEHGPFLTAEEG